MSSEVLAFRVIMVRIYNKFSPPPPPPLQKKKLKINGADYFLVSISTSISFRSYCYSTIRYTYARDRKGKGQEVGDSRAYHINTKERRSLLTSGLAISTHVSTGWVLLALDSFKSPPVTPSEYLPCILWKTKIKKILIDFLVLSGS